VSPFAVGGEAALCQAVRHQIQKWGDK